MAAEARRDGAVLFEMVIALSIIVLISLASVSVLRAVSDKERFDVATRTLLQIDSAFAPFRTQVGVNPGKISHLATLITTSDSSPCALYTASHVGGWPGTLQGGGPPGTPPSGGPYINKVFPKDSFALQGIGTIHDDITRDPPAPGGTQRFHLLQFAVTGVQRADAVELNERIDGSADLDPASPSNLTGQLQWGEPDGLGFVTLDYRVIIPRFSC